MATSTLPPRRIFIVNRFFHPDHSATSQIASDLGFHLAERGHSVTAVCARLLYEGGTDALARDETLRGVRIRRLATTGFGRTSLFGRLADYASFYCLAFLMLARELRAGDIVICKTDPPMLSIVAAVACRLRGAALVNWLQDVFPEVAQATGVARLPRPVMTMLRAWRNRSLCAASANVAIGYAMQAHLLRQGVPAERTHVIPNWSDDKIAPVEHDSNMLRSAWGIEPNEVIVAYSGNLGHAHDFATLLDAARRLDPTQPVRFLMVGGGAKTAAMQAAVDEGGLAERFLFKPYQPRDQLSMSLGCGDIHWLSLTPALEGLIVPSKIYGILSAGRPFVFVGDMGGEIGQIVARHGGGFTVQLGDGAALAAIIDSLTHDAEARARLGAQAHHAAAHYSRASALRQWDELIAAVQDQ